MLLHDTGNNANSCWIITGNLRLSVPSVVFAEATWYGSLRGGLESNSGGDLRFYDDAGGSRWGIRGSNEVSDGLTAVYQFEHSISTTNAGLPGGRLAYAGLSGGFGSLTLGQIWSASYNHVGAITDKSFYLGNSTTSYRHGNVLSYAFSSGPVGFQLDLISDGDMSTGQGIDKTEFGVTVGLGDVGSIALAHTTLRDTVTAMPTYWVRVAPPAGSTSTVNPGGTTKAEMITVLYAADDTTNVNTDGELLAAGIDAIRFAEGKYRVDTAGSECDATDADATDACMTTTAYVSSDVTRAAGDAADTVVHQTFHIEGTAVGNIAVTPAGTVDEPGHKNTHLAVQFNVGGMTPYLGHSTRKNNQAIMGVTKTKTTHYGVSGGLGDTGINFLVAARSVKPDAGAKTSPWLFNLSKNLGGGATVLLEHLNTDNAQGTKRTRVGLHVSF